MKILFLDDDKERIRVFMLSTSIYHELHIAETAKDAITHLINYPEPWDLVYLDHDLGGKQMVASGPGTGYEVACWIEEHEPVIQQIVIHSWNPAGAARMAVALRHYPGTKQEPWNGHYPLGGPLFKKQ